MSRHLPKGPDRRKLTEAQKAQKVEIRHRYACGGITQTQLVAQYGVCRTTVWKIINQPAEKERRRAA